MKLQFIVIEDKKNSNNGKKLYEVSVHAINVTNRDEYSNSIQELAHSLDVTIIRSNKRDYVATFKLSLKKNQNIEETLESSIRKLKPLTTDLPKRQTAKSINQQSDNSGLPTPQALNQPLIKKISQSAPLPNNPRKPHIEIIFNAGEPLSIEFIGSSFADEQKFNQACKAIKSAIKQDDGVSFVDSDLSGMTRKNKNNSEENNNNNIRYRQSADLNGDSRKHIFTQLENLLITYNKKNPEIALEIIETYTIQSKSDNKKNDLTIRRYCWEPSASLQINFENDPSVHDKQIISMIEKFLAEKGKTLSHNGEYRDMSASTTAQEFMEFLQEAIQKNNTDNKPRKKRR